MRYRFQLAEPLSPDLLHVFVGFMVAGHDVVTARDTVIEGDVIDQSDLFSVLDRIESLGLRLVSVNPVIE
jgi:hypothetical protein